MKSGVRVPHRPFSRIFAGSRLRTLEKHWFFEGLFCWWVVGGGWDGWAAFMGLPAGLPVGPSVGFGTCDSLAAFAGFGFGNLAVSGHGQASGAEPRG